MALHPDQRGRLTSAPAELCRLLPSVPALTGGACCVSQGAVCYFRCGDVAGHGITSRNVWLLDDCVLPPELTACAVGCQGLAQAPWRSSGNEVDAKMSCAESQRANMGLYPGPKGAYLALPDHRGGNGRAPLSQGRPV